MTDDTEARWAKGAALYAELDVLTRALLAAGDPDCLDDDQSRRADAAETALRASLARIRAVVEAGIAVMAPRPPECYEMMADALTAITADDRRLLGMD